VCQWTGDSGAVKVKGIVLNLRRKCIIIVCQIDTCGPGEDERRNLWVNVYGSGHCMSEWTGDSGVAMIRKGTKLIWVLQRWWQRDGGEGRHLEPEGITHWRVYGSCLVNLFLLNIELKCCHFCWQCSKQRYHLIYSHWWLVPPNTHHLYSLR